MIRVLHINSSLSTNSGVMRVIMNYYGYIDKSEIRFDFMYYIESENNYKQTIENNNGKYYMVESPRKLIKFKKDLAAFFQQHKDEYDIVHLHDVFLARFIYKIAKHNGVKKVIVHSHAAEWSSHFIGKIRNRLLCKNIQCFSDTYFACSEAAGDHVFKNLNYKVINNAVDLEKFSFSELKRTQLRQAMRLEGKIVIGHVGRFNPQKNHPFIIEVFNEIVKQRPNAVLLLIGEGKLQQDIKSMAYKMNLTDKMLFLNNRTDVNDLYSAMDVFILPSLYEGLPMAGVEAQAAGLRCVMSENVTKEAAIGDVAFLKLSDSIEVWANEIIQKAESERTANAFQTAKSKGFSIADEAKKLSELYKQLIS